jgi:hypothetical protein
MIQTSGAEMHEECSCGNPGGSAESGHTRLVSRPLYRARKLILEKAAKLAAGEPVPLTKGFAKEVRTKLCWAMHDSSPASIQPEVGINPSWEDVGQHLQLVLLRSWGRTTRLAPSTGTEAHGDVTGYVINHATDEEVVEVVEAWFDAIGAAIKSTHAGSAGWIGYVPMEDGEVVHGTPIQERCSAAFRQAANDIFDLHDIGYQINGTEVVERESMVMHAEVVAPVLSLLHGDKRLAAVERAYQHALRELKPEGDPADAITDAATALQEMLQALGAKGNALGPLKADAIRMAILRPYDAKLVDWTSAIRSDRGDAHSASQATPEEAWLVVHVVGALILQLEGHLR